MGMVGNRGYAYLMGSGLDSIGRLCLGAKVHIYAALAWVHRYSQCMDSEPERAVPDAETPLLLCLAIPCQCHFLVDL